MTPIVEECDGRIEVASEVRKGTRFVVRLPVRKATEEDEAARVVQAAASTGVRGRILVVDDDEAIRAAMVRMLRSHDVVPAASGGEAQKILEADQAFDLILCDMMTPEISGVDLHEWLLATHPDLAEQVVLITGGASTPKARELLSKMSNLAALGLQKSAILIETAAKRVRWVRLWHLVTKPFDNNELRARVEVGCGVVGLQSTLAWPAHESHPVKAG